MPAAQPWLPLLPTPTPSRAEPYASTHLMQWFKREVEAVAVAETARQEEAISGEGGIKPGMLQHCLITCM